MDWLSRMAASGRLTHTEPPLTMRTLWIAVIKAYEIQGCYQMLNAFNAYGIDHVVLVKLASAAVVSWLLGLRRANHGLHLSRPDGRAAHEGLPSAR